MMKHVVFATLLATAGHAYAQTGPSPAPPPAPAPTPAPSPAPPPGPAAPLDDQKKAEAKALYEQGLTHYNLGEFDQAIASFRASYAISSAPGLLFNIAQSFRLKKDYEQATYFYQTYLRLKPDAPNRVDVEARLEEMKALIEEQKKMENRPPNGTVPPENTGTTTTPTTTTPVTAAVTPPPVTERPVVDDGSGKKLVLAGYITAGAGAALVITGVIFGAKASSAESDLEKLNSGGTWSQANQDKYDAGKRDNTIAIVSFAVGGAAIIGGGALWYLGHRKESSTRVSVVPTKTGTTFAVGWSF